MEQLSWQSWPWTNLQADPRESLHCPMTTEMHITDVMLDLMWGHHTSARAAVPLWMSCITAEPWNELLVCRCTTLQASASCDVPRVGTSLFSWKDSHPYLAGLIAGLGAWALQLTSLHYIRRRWFDVSPFSLTARWPAMATRMSHRNVRHTVSPHALCYSLAAVTRQQKQGLHSEGRYAHEVLPGRFT